jgi:hypothetical protein
VGDSGGVPKLNTARMPSDLDEEEEEAVFEDADIFRRLIVDEIKRF